MIASVRVHRFIKINVRKSTRTCNPTNSRSATSSGTRSLNLSSMKFNLSPVVLSVFGLLCVGQQIQAARILALVPTPSYSHQIPYRRLWLELHKHGHEVVLVTSNPIPNMDPKTFQQIDISEAYKDIREVDFMHLRFDKVEWLAFVEEYLFSMAHVFVEHVLNHTDMRPIYALNSNRKFDVVMAEMLAMPAIYAFAHRFDAPLIGMSSLGMLSINEHALGGLVLPSHEYTWEMEANVGTNQPFWRRLQNYIKLSRLLYVMYRDLFPRQQNLAEHYFGPLPPLLDILKNTSVVFVNQADAITPARPKLANMITFTSFHVEKTPTPLPADLQRFLDNATEGFIYLSLGSNAMSSSMPKKILGVFLEVFARLPYKVVWKFEKDMPNKPDNIYTGKWLPQQSILAHPNIKLFIYQGGLQSSEEAIHFSVPLLGFPVLADQDYQVLRMEALGVAKYMDIVTITREELETTIKEMITNKEYKDKIIALKELVNDTPYDMVEYLAWWVEYVIRNKGASHLRSKLAHQPWYQRCDMDIVVFLTIVSVLIISSITSIIAKITVQWYKYYQMISPPGKQKIR
ncbi:UDP-glucosyltransferase 2 [Megalopta genalis]|uniref:UDP-glucosyltransferase 2 n=1 Tax=Megalopta genalis TaxID=115081 RepID=UPI003FD59F60